MDISFECPLTERTLYGFRLFLGLLRYPQVEGPMTYQPHRILNNNKKKKLRELKGFFYLIEKKNYVVRHVHTTKFTVLF